MVTDDKDNSKPDSERPRNASGSFLVRFWVESADSGEQVLRGCVKNLKTGKEHYVADPERIGDLVRGQLKDRGRESTQADPAAVEPSWAGRH
ncbi:MAG TPA: hypothetical protein DD490_06555 [Acidobacteria bacterium]|nr:hypothetical protein [Acidobacteriota bacterium]